MTLEQQRIKLAEAFGWTQIKVQSNQGKGKRQWKGGRNITGICPKTGEGEWHSQIPDFLNDLNAVHEAEKALDMHYNQAWIEALLQVCLHDAAIRLEKTDGWDWSLLCARSTAAQRTEALLKILNLWED